MSMNSVGQISPDGRFQWDGANWIPLAAGTRIPTSWTWPMQLAVAAYLVTGVIGSALVFIGFNSSVLIDRLQSQPQYQNLSPDQLQQAAQMGMTFAYVGASCVGILYLIMAFGALVRWRWVFWVQLVLGTIGICSIFGLVSNSALLPGWIEIYDGVIYVALVALDVFMYVGLFRYGPWAMRKPSAVA